MSAKRGGGGHDGGAGGGGQEPDMTEQAMTENTIHELMMEVDEIDRAMAENMASYLKRWTFFRRGGLTSSADDEGAGAAGAPGVEAASSTGGTPVVSLKDHLKMQEDELRRVAEGATVVQRSTAGGGINSAVSSGIGVDAARSVAAPAAAQGLSDRIDPRAAAAAGAGPRANASTAAATAAPRIPLANRLIFRKVNPRRVPIMQRWWVPVVCVASLVLIWTPDMLKLRAIYRADHEYQRVKFNIHSWYWRLTMDEERYNLLMKQLEEGVPKSLRVKATDCPL